MITFFHSYLIPNRAGLSPIQAYKNPQGQASQTTENSPISRLLPKKKVHFDGKVRVVLVPTRGDLQAAGITKDLWWMWDNETCTQKKEAYRKDLCSYLELAKLQVFKITPDLLEKTTEEVKKVFAERLALHRKYGLKQTQDVAETLQLFDSTEYASKNIEGGDKELVFFASIAVDTKKKKIPETLLNTKTNKHLGIENIEAMQIHKTLLEQKLKAAQQ